MISIFTSLPNLSLDSPLVQGDMCKLHARIHDHPRRVCPTDVAHRPSHSRTLHTPPPPRLKSHVLTSNRSEPMRKLPRKPPCMCMQPFLRPPKLNLDRRRGIPPQPPPLPPPPTKAFTGKTIAHIHMKRKNVQWTHIHFSK